MGIQSFVLENVCREVVLNLSCTWLYRRSLKSIKQNKPKKPQIPPKIMAGSPHLEQFRFKLLWGAAWALEFLKSPNRTFCGDRNAQHCRHEPRVAIESLKCGWSD